jgi:hypothetical protein
VPTTVMLVLQLQVVSARVYFISQPDWLFEPNLHAYLPNKERKVCTKTFVPIPEERLAIVYAI